MSFNDEMTGLMNAARNATQLTSKMSINDLTNYVTGLAPINYLDNIVDEQTVETKNGDYGVIISSAQLEKDIYCLSAQVSPSESRVSLRVDFNGGAAQPLSSSIGAHDWGLVGGDWVNPGETVITTIPFKVTKAGKFKFGLSGNPFAGGEAKVEKMMLNKGKLPLPFTERTSQPTINGPLSITYPKWTKSSGWGNNLPVIVPVFKGVPIYATVEIKDIASTKSDEGPSLLCNYMDKNMTKLSYWNIDSNGNYNLTNGPVVQLIGDNFSNKNGLRSGYRVFDESNIRNVAYLSIDIGNNINTTYSIRNLVVSYYKPYDFTSEGKVNLLDFGQSYGTSVDKQAYKLVTGLDIDGWNKLIGSTITISFDLEWSNYKPIANSNNRIGMEWALKYESHEETWENAWYLPQTSDGKEHVVHTVTIPNDKIVSIDGGFYNQVNPECTFKATNFKVVVDSTDR